MNDSSLFHCVTLRGCARYGIFAVVAAAVLLYEIRFTVYNPGWMVPRVRVQKPFVLQPDPTTSQLLIRTTSAVKEDLKPGDALVSVNGRSVHGIAAYEEAISVSRPGDTLTVTARRNSPNGAALVRSAIVLGRAPATQALDPSQIVNRTVLVVVPAIFVFLGLWTVAVRPRDKRAWLLLAVLVSFGAYFNPMIDAWTPGLVEFEVIYSVIASDLLLVWLLLLAIHFPEPFAASTRAALLSGLVWLLVVPCIAITAFDSALYLGQLDYFPLASSLISYAGRVQTLEKWLQLLILLVTCALFAAKFRLASSNDAKRRMRLLFLAAVSTAIPIVTLIIICYRRGVPVETQQFPSWGYVPALLLFYIFPAALAHLIVVHRALDVRVVLRQGLQYLLARRGLSAFRIMVLLAVFGWVFTIASSNGSTANDVALVLGIAFVILALEQAVGERLSESVDRMFFSEAVKGEELLRHLCSGSYLETATLLETMTRGMAAVMKTRYATALVRDGDQFTSPVLASEAADLAIPARGGVVRRCLVNKRPQHVYFDDDASWVHRLGNCEQAALQNLNTELIVPLVRNQEVLGLLSLGPRLTEQPYSSNDINALSSIARQLSLALENTQLVSRLAGEITERERKNAEKEAAENASKAKSAFLAQMSHELRTPLNAIIGYSEMLHDEAADAGMNSFQKDLTKITNAGRYLLALIDSILDFSKIEAGKMELYLERFAVGQLIEDTLSIISPLVAKKRNRLDYQPNSDLGFMTSDPVKFRQTLFNLISNAAKFTEDGVVSVIVEPFTKDDTGWLRVKVSDTGIGMTPEQTARLFNAFTQADNSITRKYGGTGLGLAICRHFCQMMGGDIGVESEWQRGTTFHFELPRDARTTPVSVVSSETAAVTGAA